MKTAHTLLLLILALGFGGCDGFFGEKISTDFLDEPVYDSRQVAYVPILPVITGFERPVDVIAGWDELIYVADSATEEIISFDQAGRELGRFRVPGLQAISQDRRLDLLASGYADTLIAGASYRLPAIYRISLKNGTAYGINQARIVKKLVHPFYFKSGAPARNDEQIRFTGIAPLADNRYFVSRTGPDNFANQFGGPDDAVLLFGSNDQFQTPVVVTTPLGAIRDFFRQPSSLVSLIQPPQRPYPAPRGDFFFASLSPGSVLKVQQIRFVESDAGSSYEVSFFPSGDFSKADGFLYDANKFTAPTDLAFTGDGTNYLFVVDAAKDSLFQFNGLGYEGVNPPRAATSTKAIRASFGGTGDGPTQFRSPRGVAYLDRVVYVADAGNKRLLRFKLTLDFD